MRSEIEKVLRDMPSFRASDLHISAGSCMRYRVDDDLLDVPFTTALSNLEAKEMIYSLMDTDQIEEFEKAKELDFSREILPEGRYRIIWLYA